MIAQGNALGHVPPRDQALKGRNKILSTTLNMISETTTAITAV
jgi:hypothetical protein